MFLQGDALNTLKDINSETVDCIITSPPYWNLRDYKVEGQIGLESTIDEYVDKLIQIFNECKRVLKKEGTCWIVLGDSYGDSHGGTGSGKWFDPKWPKARNDKWVSRSKGILSKSLCMIPERFAIKMIDNGWILRNKIIWYKPNCMPSSATDRFTVDYEYIYFFVKSKKYYFKTQYEPMEKEWHGLKSRGSLSNKTGWKASVYNESYHKPKTPLPNPQGRIKRTVWKIPDKPWSTNNKPGSPYEVNNPRVAAMRKYEEGIKTQGRVKRTVWRITTKPFPEAHFAVFPEELVKQCMDAGCPSEICVKCDKARIQQYESKSLERYELPKDDERYRPARYDKKYPGQGMRYSAVTDLGLSDCGCNAGFKQGIILDPFSGAGTTALVATKNNRQFIGIELNPDYIQISKKRLEPYIKQQRLVPYFI